MSQWSGYGNCSSAANGGGGTSRRWSTATSSFPYHPSTSTLLNGSGNGNGPSSSSSSSSTTLAHNRMLNGKSELLRPRLVRVKEESSHGFNSGGAQEPSPPPAGTNDDPFQPNWAHHHPHHQPLLSATRFNTSVSSEAQQGHSYNRSLASHHSRPRGGGRMTARSHSVNNNFIISQFTTTSMAKPSI